MFWYEYLGIDNLVEGKAYDTNVGRFIIDNYSLTNEDEVIKWCNDAKRAIERMDIQNDGIILVEKKNI